MEQNKISKALKADLGADLNQNYKKIWKNDMNIYQGDQNTYKSANNN